MPFSFGGMQKKVQTMRTKIGLPSTFTLDACRHGGMTELQEAELTDGQGPPFPLTRVSKHTKGMPSAQSNARCRPLASVTLIV